MCKYVHARVLNGYNCVILPFFEPISIVDRRNETVLNAIENILKQIGDKNMAFRDCDRKWRHVGRFNNKIYLFDLAELQHCDTNEAAKAMALDHLRVLREKSFEQPSRATGRSY